MQISITIDDMNFDLELDVKPGYYKPAKLTGDPDSWGESESQEHEFDIESVCCVKSDSPELMMKSFQLLNNDYSDEERFIILARIDEELELLSKYSVEP